MRTEAVYALLTEMREEFPDLQAELGRRDPDIAYLKLWDAARPERWAVAYSPGDRWFDVETDTRFSFPYFEEDTPDDEAGQIIRRNVALAALYVRIDAQPMPAKVLGGEAIRLVLDGEEYVLTLSVSEVFRSWFNIGRLWKRRGR